jgi:hypothetical protein
MTEATEKGRLVTTSREVYLGFGCAPPLVLYVQKIRGSTDGYEFYLNTVLAHLLNQCRPEDVVIGFWPEVKGEAIRVLSGEAVKKDPREFNAVLTSARGTPDPSQFKSGLGVCSDIASKSDASIIVITNGESVGPFDLFKEDASAQAKSLEEVSRKHRVYVIAYGEPAYQYAKHVSGYAVSVHPGQINMDRKTKP